jgi:hypothetical protein
MGTTVDGSVTTFDGQWHHLHLPLTNFREKGAWYDGTWYNPDNRFNWAEVDRFEIVPEAKALGDAHLYFDNIHITDQDTATVRQEITGEHRFLLPETESGPSLLDVSIYPNPSHGQVTFLCSASGLLRYNLSDPAGRMILSGEFYKDQQIDLSFLPDGIYILSFTDRKGRTDSGKLLLQKG